MSIEDFGKVVLALLLVGVLIFGLWSFATPGGRAAWNQYSYQLQKVDDNTLYSTRKQVEDTCRAMISSYTTDKMTYEQYKDSDNSDEKSWAAQAKMRANKTASSYNNYILQNSYVWKNNVPADIKNELPYLE